jgi:chromosomal replication initiation ATPase DnaA
MLWIIGKAGAGKAHLAARVIGKLKLSASKLAYFYCDAKDDGRRSVNSILRNWTWQLLQQDRFCWMMWFRS